MWWVSAVEEMTEMGMTFHARFSQGKVLGYPDVCFVVGTGGHAGEGVKALFITNRLHG
jgi:hypothetical protein